MRCLVFEELDLEAPCLLVANTDVQEDLGGQRRHEEMAVSLQERDMKGYMAWVAPWG
jgi:hypothetical protein